MLYLVNHLQADGDYSVKAVRAWLVEVIGKGLEVFDSSRDDDPLSYF